MFVSPHSPSPADLNDLQTRLGVRFIDDALLLQALTHRSWVEEKFPGGRAPAHLSQGRLAFLGDAKLGEVVARALFYTQPTATEGDLTKLAETYKRGSWLTARGKALGLDELLRAGRGGATNLIDNPKVLENTMEAVLGALVADEQGDAVERIVTGWIAAHAPTLAEAPAPEKHPNPIGAINELYQRLLRGSAPTPVASSYGPDHMLSWDLSLDLTGIGLEIYNTTGSTKKAAHAAACREALRDARAFGLL